MSFAFVSRSRRPLALLTTVLCLCQAAPGRAAARRQEATPGIKSASALVVDLRTGQPLFERDADTVRPIASLSKMVSALVIQEDCKLDPEGYHEMTVHNREAARGGDKSKLTTGWRYTHRDLLHAALMRSDNRALPALGEACGLTMPEFAGKMNERVRRLGLTKTFFREPTGLSVENVSTAREVLVILTEVLKIPELTEIMGKATYEITAVKDGRSPRLIKIRNTDRLLTKNIARILGGKTGYTDIARYCLAVAARTDAGQDVGMVFLGAEGRFTRFADFTRVIAWLRRVPQSLAAAVPKPGAAKINLSGQLPRTVPYRDATAVATPLPVGGVGEVGRAAGAAVGGGTGTAGASGGVGSGAGSEGVEEGPADAGEED